MKTARFGTVRFDCHIVLGVFLALSVPFNSPHCQRLARAPEVPEPDAAVVAGSGQVVLLVGVEVEAADDGAAGRVQAPLEAVHRPDVPPCTEEKRGRGEVKS